MSFAAVRTWRSAGCVTFWFIISSSTRSSWTSVSWLFRYLLAIGGWVVVNYVGLKFFVEFCGLWATPSQMLATFVTMIYSYLAAKYFTFRHAEV